MNKFDRDIEYVKRQYNLRKIEVQYYDAGVNVFAVTQSGRLVSGNGDWTGEALSNLKTKLSALRVEELKSGRAA